MINRNKNWKLNSGLAGTARLISIACSFILLPKLLHIMGDSRYGTWIVITGSLQWLTFFNLGFTNGLRNQLTQYFSSNKTNEINVLLSSSYVFFTSFGLIIFSLFVIAINFLDINQIIPNSVLTVEEIRLMLLFVGSSIFIKMISGIFNSVLFACHKAGHVPLITAIAQIIVLLGVFVFERLSVSNIYYIYGLILYAYPLLLLGYSVFFFSKKKIVIRYKYFDFSELRDIRILSVNFFLVEVLGVLFFSSIPWMINWIEGPEMVASFAIVERLFMVPLMVNGIMLAPVWSYVSELWSKRNVVDIRGILQRSYLVTLVPLALVWLIALLSDDLVKLWLKSQVEISGTLIRLYALFVSVRILAQPYSKCVNGIGYLRLTILAGVFVVPIFYLMFWYFSSRLTIEGVVILLLLFSMPGWITQLLQIRAILNGSQKDIFYV